MAVDATRCGLVWSVAVPRVCSTKYASFATTPPSCPAPARTLTLPLMPGIFAIRDERDYVLEEDFLKAARKVAECKKLESKLDYSKV